MSTEIINQGLAQIKPLVLRQFGDEAKAKSFLATVYRIATMPEMASCTVESIKLAAYQAAELGLTPVNGQCYFVKYGNACQLVLGYRGMISLAEQAGIGGVQSAVVRAGDDWQFWYDSQGGGFRHIPKAPLAAPVTHAWACCKSTNGITNWVVLTKAQLDKYQAFSKTKFGPWKDHYDMMAEKTAIRRLFHRIGMLPSKIQAAIIRDENLSVGAREVVDVQAEYGPEVAAAIGTDTVEYAAVEVVQPDTQDALTAALDRLETPGLTMAGVEAVWKENPSLQNDPTFKAAVVAAKDRAKAL